ncbi:putative F-box protein At3g16210, partial [Asparagus officinalis]
SLARFRCVCKQWLSLSFDPYFVEKHQQANIRLLFFSQVFTAPKIRLYELGDCPRVEDCSFDFKPQFRNDHSTYKLSNSVDGLVCVTQLRDGRHLYLLNPFSKEVVRLPPPPSGRRGRKSNRVGLGVDPTTGIYKLVRLFRKEDRYWDPWGCEVLSVGPHQEWQNLGDTPCILSWLDQVAVFVNGFLHWWAPERQVMAFDLTTHKFQLIPTPEPMKGHHRVFLVESGGNLCFVEYPSCHRRFSTIWRLEDRVTHNWTKRHNIDLSNLRPGTLCRSIICIRGHEILLEIKDDKNLMIYSYNFFTKTLHRRCNHVKPSGLGFITESLVSPRSLIGSISH